MGNKSQSSVFLPAELVNCESHINTTCNSELFVSDDVNYSGHVKSEVQCLHITQGHVFGVWKHPLYFLCKT